MHPLQLRPLAPAWRGPGLAWSRRHQDSYHNRTDPLLQGQEIFVRGVRLPQLAAGEVPCHHPAGPLIGETGFGAGLNFLLSLRCFLRAAPESRRLHYLAFDRALWPAEDMLALHRGLGLGDEAAMLLRAIPPSCGGTHRLELAGGRVQLTLVLGEIAETLPVWARDAQARGYRCDGWYLDGFAPARNRDMWSEPVLRHVTQMTAPGGVASSWTSATAVRAGLAREGWEVRRHEGVAGKRHSMEATMPGRRATRTDAGVPAQVRVLGAGPAGACAANALARQGCEVQVLHPATPAKGTDSAPLPCALMRWRPSSSSSPAALVRLAAWRHSLAALAEAPGCTPTPVLERVAGRRARDRVRKLLRRHGEPPGVSALDQARAEELAGVPLPPPGLDHGKGKGADGQLPPWLLLRDGALVQAPTLLQAWLGHHNIRTAEIPAGESVPPTPDIPSVWAAGFAGPLAPWGSSETGFMHLAAQSDSDLRAPRIPLAGDGWRYGFAQDGQSWLAASPKGSFGLAQAQRQHAGLRHRSHDLLPLVGALEGTTEGQAEMHAMTGFGSFAFLQIPLCARLLVDRLCGLPPPLSPDLADLLLPTTARLP